MRKLSLIAVCMTSLLSAQTIFEDNFDTYEVGNVLNSKQDYDGYTEWYGQGNYSMLLNDNETDYDISNFQFQEEAGRGKVLVNRATPSKDYFPIDLRKYIDFWDATENILRFELDLNPNSSANSNAMVGIVARNLGGFTYNTKTKEIKGLFYLNGFSGLSEYVIALGNKKGTGEADREPLYINDNEWVRIKVEFDKTTKTIRYSIPQYNTEVSIKETGDYDLIATTPSALLVQNYKYEEEGVSTVFPLVKIDNVSMNSSSGSLGIDENTVKSMIKVYPNPVINEIHVTNASAKTNYKVYNTAGQLVLSGELSNRKIQAEKLTSGVYFLVLESNGKQTQTKFIKK
ncbi:T9SS type A sorting domain-containing protein [Empedobacter brevis]|uniref:T9SS type A sorting domain-containing protein n=1 Tax=Empedobacter brevis TaxID=247 RepID=UPI00289B8768|nr:T9SS type A sorting domain-containing protein [Empedobacter brevis]